MGIIMDKDTVLIIATTVGAIGTIATPFISWYLTRERLQKGLGEISASAHKILNNSTWAGNGFLENGPKDFHGEYETHMHLEINGKFIFGEYSYEPKKHILTSPSTTSPKMTIQVRGGFVQSGFLRLNFQTTISDNPHFGVMIFRLNEMKRVPVLDGKWIAFGSNAQDLVVGSATLQKKI